MMYNTYSQKSWNLTGRAIIADNNIYVRYPSGHWQVIPEHTIGVIDKDNDIELLCSFQDENKTKVRLNRIGALQSQIRIVR